MSHFAKVVDGIVTEVIVAEPEFFETFVDDSPGEWIQTSYNTHGGIHYDPVTREPSADQSKALRKNYAGIGMIYDRDRDAFYHKKPFPSAVFNEEMCNWDHPVPRPNDENNYEWNEENQTWDLVETSE